MYNQIETVSVIDFKNKIISNLKQLTAAKRGRKPKTTK
jgi:hypothetical protein